MFLFFHIRELYHISSLVMLSQYITKFNFFHCYIGLFINIFIDFILSFSTLEFIIFTKLKKKTFLKLFLKL
jgi:hypothetical protein